MNRPPAVGCRLTAVRCPLPAGHCHSERSEESRCLLLVISMPINTGRREDGASMYSRRGPRLSAWRGDSPALPRGLKVVFADAQGAKVRLSAVRCPLPAGHCHSERSEESRCVQYLRQTVLNTGRREGTASMYSRKQEGSGAFGARVQAASGLRPGRLRFRPGTAPPSGLVQREL